MSEEYERHFRELLARRRRLRNLLRPLPRRANIRRYPVIKRFAEMASKRPYLWSFKREQVVPALYVGGVISLLPLYGVQFLAALGAALLFRANLTVLIALQFITNPFTIVPLYLVAYQFGRLLTGDGAGFVAPPEFSASAFVGWTEAMQSWMLSVAKPLGLGLVALACALAVLGYLATRAIWRLYLVSAWRRRRHRS